MSLFEEMEERMAKAELFNEWVDVVGMDDAKELILADRERMREELISFLHHLEKDNELWRQSPETIAVFMDRKINKVLGDGE